MYVIIAGKGTLNFRKKSNIVAVCIMLSTAVIAGMFVYNANHSIIDGNVNGRILQILSVTKTITASISDYVDIIVLTVLASINRNDNANQNHH